MWYKINNSIKIFTPSILVFPDRVEENIKRMIGIAGDPSRLRPHVKTHKLGEIIQLQVKHGITKFKCATLSEMLMVAKNGGKDILLSYPLYGPGIVYLFELINEYPQIRFAVTVDNQVACNQLSKFATSQGKSLDVFIDVDNGMHRTGINPKDAMQLAEYISKNDYLIFAGLHVYDGHIHESEIGERTAHCQRDFEEVKELIDVLKKLDINCQEIVCGGTFTFPVHVEDKTRTLSPGTPIFWDGGYTDSIPEMEFLPAAVLAGRVISKPKGNLCLDFGYKSIASEMPHPRIHFLDLDVREVINHSEEHLVVSAHNQAKYIVGDVVFGLPHHVCPTIALHEEVYVVKNGKATGTWKVEARKRIY